jgi:hypothetical protein
MTATDAVEQWSATAAPAAIGFHPDRPQFGPLSSRTNSRPERVTPGEVFDLVASSAGSAHFGLGKIGGCLEFLSRSGTISAGRETGRAHGARKAWLAELGLKFECRRLTNGAAFAERCVPGR